MKIVPLHSWLENVKELLHTLRRAAIWSKRETVSAEDTRDALLPTGAVKESDILD